MDVATNTDASGVPALPAMPARPAPRMRRTPRKEGTMLGGKKLKDFTPEDKKAYQNLRTLRSRTMKRQRKQAESYKFGSAAEVSKADALEILSTRIVNPHVREVAYELALEAAAANNLPVNRFFLANGLQKTLESKRARAEVRLDIDPKPEIRSEVIHTGDLHAIWDYSVSWREDISFEDFIATRKKLKSDWMAVAPFIDGREFCEKPHREWQQFLPIFDPALPPNYTQAQENEWLKQQKSAIASEEVRDYLLMASRNSWKSSAGLCFLTCAVLCAPSIRILLISETTKLSKGFIKAFRSIWEVGHERTRFQYWFPEYCIPQGDGRSQTYECPLRHLKLPQETASVASLEMAMAGGRFSICWADDVISNINTANEEQRVKGIETYDALMKLREVGSSIVITVGTPWVIGDLYFELQRRNADDPQKSTAILVQPAWVVKPGRQRPIPLLTENDVELAFPSRLTFKFLMKEARANLPLFRSQNLLEYTDEDDDIRCSFRLEDLNAAIRPANAFALATKIYRVLSIDQAFSTSRYADYSCLAVMDMLKNINDRTKLPENIVFVKDVRLERMRTSDLAVAICEFVHTHRPDHIVIERSGDWSGFQEAIVRAFLLRGRIVPQIYWKPTANAQGTGMMAKTARIKTHIEPLLQENKLFFSAGIQILDECFGQIVKFDGIHKSGSTRKDDFPDALALGLETFYPRTFQPEHVDQAQVEYEENARIQTLLAAQHERYFGSPSMAPIQEAQTEHERYESYAALYGTLDRYGLLKRRAA
jgi:hypothetical protein